ncbi:MAG: hypothetical protein AABX01_05270 [Candidatus Micrarchaeota archaeon]
MTMCTNCGKPFLDCCEDRELCADCIKKSVRAKVDEYRSKINPALKLRRN